MNSALPARALAKAGYQCQFTEKLKRERAFSPDLNFLFIVLKL
jgi:hypothetical protein